MKMNLVQKMTGASLLAVGMAIAPVSYGLCRLKTATLLQKR